MNGYNEKIMLLLEHMMSRLKTIAATLEDSEAGNRVASESDTADADISNVNINDVGGDGGSEGQGDGAVAETESGENKADMFARLREKLRKGYKTRAFNNPVFHAGNSTTNCIHYRRWTDEDALVAIEGQRQRYCA